MKSFNNSSVKALVLVAGVLASHFALAASAGNADGGLMKQMLNDSNQVSVVRSADAQQKLQNVHFAKDAGNGGLAATMQASTSKVVSGDYQTALDSIQLGDTATQGRS
jgi:hypothetical protein